MERVLFAPIGDTDPVRNDFDGPILHIVRHYHPQTVYLFINKRFEERDRQQDIYARLIKLISPDCCVEKIYTGIDDPSDFDAFNEIMKRSLDEIAARHPAAEILLNISSGTPQMIACLCLEAVSGRYRCRPVQVKTPQKNSNAGVGHLQDGTVENIWENLMDNLPEAENRCVEPEILGFRRARLTAELRGMLQTYDYKAAHQLLKQHPGFFSQTAAKIAEHAMLRIDLHTHEANLLAQKLNPELPFDLFPVKNARAKEIVEYFLVFDVKRKKRELSDFVLRLSPLATALAACFLERFYQLERTRLIEYDQRKVPWYSIPKLQSIDMELASWVVEPGQAGVKPSGRIYYSLENTLKICRYFSEMVKTHTEPLTLELLEQFKSLREVERNVRNLAAHEITAVSEEMIIDASGGLDSARIADKVKDVIKKIFGNEVKSEVFNIYERINAHIDAMVS